MNGNKCYWSVTSNKCTLYANPCDAAPITVTTESACQTYFSSCTVKLSGGCIKKSTCNAAAVKGACSTDVNGVMCHWTGSLCRYKECGDYEGSSYS